MWKNGWIAGGLLVAAVMISGCGGAVELAPIAGEWTCNSPQNQVWAYEFPSDQSVVFKIDSQRQKWGIQAIRKQGSMFEIDVDTLFGRGGNQGSTIRIQKQGENTIVVTSGLHQPMTFQKS